MCCKKRKIAVIGYGNRARKYLKYIEANPDKAEIAAIVEIEPRLLDSARERYKGSKTRFYSRTEDFFNERPELDGVIIATPDDSHYRLAMDSISRHWNVLLEKPAAQSMEECEEIRRFAEEKQVKVFICYVLRYHPYFKKLKEILHSKQLGDIISIDHRVNVGPDRMTHTFVRGIWSETGKSNPMILSKCCHDMDLLLWFSESVPVELSSSGSLSFFRAENAPEGSAARCSACKIEATCPYSAIDLYQRRRDWISNFICPGNEDIEGTLEKIIHESPYGRCVFRCTNDVVDNQTVNMDMKNGISIKLTLDGLSEKENRETFIKCTHGEISADEKTIRVKEYDDGKEQTFDFSECLHQPLHANADLAIAADFIDSIDSKANPDSPSISTAIESHRVCFLAEESRLCNSKKISLIQRNGDGSPESSATLHE